VYNLLVDADDESDLYSADGSGEHDSMQEMDDLNETAETEVIIDVEISNKKDKKEKHR